MASRTANPISATPVTRSSTRRTAGLPTTCRARVSRCAYPTSQPSVITTWITTSTASPRAPGRDGGASVGSIAV